MLLRIVSDIHAEFLTHKNRAEVLQTLLGSSSAYDYLVIAGDLTVTNHKSVLKEFYDITQKPIIFVPGNHDFWGTSYRVKDLELRKQISDGKYGQHLHYLNNDSFIDGNHLIIGSTLWWQEQPENWTYLMRQMIDYHKITEMFTGRENGFDWGQEAMSFIIERLQFARDNALTPIVITHNAPSYRSVSDRFKHSPMNPFFANQCEAIIEEYQPRVWIHGHMHSSCKYKIGNTLVLCNPYGYHGHEVNSEFRSNLIIGA